jgi:hypothetical protein
MKAVLVLATLVALVAAPDAAKAGPAAPAGVARFALVVGYNQAPRADLVTLRYADDDAVRWSVLMRTFGARVELLTELDDESRRLYADSVAAPAAPTAAGLRAAMARLANGIATARAAGQRTAFYFIYAGHGDTGDDGEGYVTLADGRFHRGDLGTQVLAISGADTNHVVVDACRAFYFVYDRGAGGTRRPFEGRYFASGLATRFRNTGFLLATSSGAPSHEWEEFQAGIFSHELRSGLLGAADVDGDGRVGYRELAAFVEVANRPIRNERYRPAFAINPPLEGEATLLDLADARGGQVVLAASGEGRRLLEDPLGIRWADVHPGRGQAVTLRIPASPWEAPHFFVRQPDGDREYRVPAGRSSSTAALPLTRMTALRRGAAHEAFVQLFSLPFTGADLATPAPSPVDLVARPAAPASGPTTRRTAAWVTMGAGALALAAAGGLYASAHLARDSAALGRDRPSINDRIDERNWWGTVSAVTGAALVGTGAVLFLLDRRATSAGDLAWLPAVAPLPGGALATVSIRR